MPANPLTDPKWAPQLADTVERVVGQVRDKATDKAVVAVRALVFGIVIGVAALSLATLALILGTKLVQRIVNVGGLIDAGSSVWVSYLVVAFLLTVVGAICMRLRHTAASPTAR